MVLSHGCNQATSRYVLETVNQHQQRRFSDYVLQVSQNGLDIVGFFIDRLASEFKPYLNTILISVLDRLGDTRQEVRDKANIVLCKLMDATVQPQALFEKITSAFSHKNSRVRVEVLLLLQNTLNAHGAGQLTVSKLIPHILTSTSDPQSAVRDAAVETLVEIYRLVANFLLCSSALH